MLHKRHVECRRGWFAGARRSRAVSRGALTAAVATGEARGEERDEQGHRQADDVQVVALDTLDERCAAALNRVGAGAALPLPGRDVRVDLCAVSGRKRTRS